VGSTLVSSGASIKEVGDEAYARELRARLATDGLLGWLMALAGSRTRSHSRELTGAAIVAGGSVNRWAQAIADYNSGVDALNAEYATARAASFGVPAPDYDSPAARQDPEQVARDHAGRVADAEQALLSALRTRLQALEQALDDAATSVSAMLDDGPSDQALLALFQAGALPMTVPGLLPDVDFSSIDVRAWLEQLAKYGDLPAGVDPAEVAAALAAIDGLLSQDDFGTNGNRDDLARMLDALRGLDPAAVDYLLLGLSDQELERLDAMASHTSDSGWNPWDHNGLDHWDLIDFHSLFLAGASAEGLRRLVNNWDSIEPSFDTTDTVVHDGTELRLGEPGGELWPLDEDGNPIIDASQMNQGNLNDCWFIASVTASTQQDSSFVLDHLRRNPNGTVTVTLYDGDGNPHQVTVTAQLPLNSSGEPAFAHGSDGELWPAYYEKAFALAYNGDDGGAPDDHGGDEFDRAENGTYAGTEWDHTDAAPPYVTGQEARGIDTTYDDVKSSFDAGHPVIVASRDNTDNVPSDQESSYHTRHVYYVEGFEDGEIVLGNPWGADYPEVRMSPEEFEENFSDARELATP